MLQPQPRILGRHQQDRQLAHLGYFGPGICCESFAVIYWWTSSHLSETNRRTINDLARASSGYQRPPTFACGLSSSWRHSCSACPSSGPPTPLPSAFCSRLGWSQPSRAPSPKPWAQPSLTSVKSRKIRRATGILEVEDDILNAPGYDLPPRARHHNGHLHHQPGLGQVSGPASARIHKNASSATSIKPWSAQST